MEKEIYKIKGIELNKLNQTAPLEKWFYLMVQKRETELSLLDISRMLRQEIYLDIAIPITWNKLIEDPFCGEMYEGQLLELLIKVLEKSPDNKQKKLYDLFSKDLDNKIANHEWSDNEDKKEYAKLVNKIYLFFS